MAFLCFPSALATKITKVSKFLLSPGRTRDLAYDHHPSKMSPSCGSTITNPVAYKQPCQTSLEYGHCGRMCSMLSSSYRQVKQGKSHLPIHVVLFCRMSKAGFLGLTNIIFCRLGEQKYYQIGLCRLVMVLPWHNILSVALVE
jgi:hypothetical protein